MFFLRSASWENWAKAPENCWSLIGPTHLLIFIRLKKVAPPLGEREGPFQAKKKRAKTRRRSYDDPLQGESWKSVGVAMSAPDMDELGDTRSTSEAVKMPEGCTTTDSSSTVPLVLLWQRYDEVFAGINVLSLIVYNVISGMFCF